MRQHVVRIEFSNALGHRNSFIVALQVLEGACQPVHRLGERRIGSQRFLIRGYSLFQVPLTHQVQRRIVVVFSFLAGVWVRHMRKIPGGDWILTRNAATPAKTGCQASRDFNAGRKTSGNVNAPQVRPKSESAKSYFFSCRSGISIYDGGRVTSSCATLSVFSGTRPKATGWRRGEVLTSCGALRPIAE